MKSFDLEEQLEEADGYATLDGYATIEGKIAKLKEIELRQKEKHHQQLLDALNRIADKLDFIAL